MDSDEKKRQQWKSRVARERLDLSASVEEALSDESTLRELEAEEFDDFEPEAEEAMLIPPRLRPPIQTVACHSRTAKSAN